MDRLLTLTQDDYTWTEEPVTEELVADKPPRDHAPPLAKLFDLMKTFFAFAYVLGCILFPPLALPLVIRGFFVVNNSNYPHNYFNPQNYKRRGNYIR